MTPRRWIHGSATELLLQCGLSSQVVILIGLFVAVVELVAQMLMPQVGSCQPQALRPHQVLLN
jgi:hypothetical protein